MKAQKLGAIPDVTDYAALSETGKNGLRIDVDIATEEGQEEYFEALIGLLKDEEKQKEIREPMMKWAEHYFDWVNVAKHWDERFRVGLANPQKRYELNTDNRQIDSSTGRPTKDTGVDVLNVSGSGVDGEQGEINGRSVGDTNGNGINKEDTQTTSGREDKLETTSPGATGTATRTTEITTEGGVN